MSRRRVLTRTRLYVVGAALLALAVTFGGFAIGWSVYAVRQRTQDLSRQVAAVSKGLAAAEAMVPGETPEAQALRDRLFRVEAQLLGTPLFVTDDAGRLQRSSTDTTIASVPMTRLGETGTTGVRTGTGRTGDGSSVLLVAAPFGEAPGRWLVAVQALNDIRTAQLGLLAIAAASLALAGLVSWFAGGVVARRLTGPLVRLRDAAESVTGGAWGAQVPEAGDDEIASLARSFNRMSSRVADAYAAQKAFVGDVSHELRTPVTSIRGFSEAILDGVVNQPGDVRRSVGIIHAEALRMAEITETLLALAELDSGTIDPCCQVIDLTGIVDALVGRHAGSAEKAGLVLSLDIPLVPRPLGDPERLLQAASQLVSNAIRYTPSGGRVRVSARAVGDEWWLSVDDSGPGIPAEKRAEIFERFTRLDGSRSKQAGGAGLGLAICRRVVELMGGRVWVEDAYLGGARFVIALPCSSARS